MTLHHPTHMDDHRTADEMRAAALRLHVEGCSAREIGERLRLSTTTAHKYLRCALARLDCEEQLSRHQLREIEHARLELCVRELWPYIQAGEIETREDGRKVITVERFNALLKASDALIKISRRISALYGLDAPRQIQVEGSGGNAAPAISQAELDATSEVRRRILAKRLERVVVRQDPVRLESPPADQPLALSTYQPAPMAEPKRAPFPVPNTEMWQPCAIQPWSRFSPP